MNYKNISRRPLFWILFALAGIGSIIFSRTYFSRALPLINIEITTSRESALQKADLLAKKYRLGPETFRQAVTFSSDKTTQFFVELEAGGKQAFNNMIREKLYEPYRWQVRHFKESEQHELHLLFTPKGKPYGFKEIISETRPGPDLTAQIAQKKAETIATEKWNIDLNLYNHVESSKETRPNGRADHTFVYELRNKQLGEGRYRLRLVVSGDNLTELTHFVKIPDDFQRRYQEMRAANKSLATAAGILVVLLYLIGGCLIGLFFLLQARFIVWRGPLFWAGLLACFQFLSAINNIPNAWMLYDTAIPAQSFFIRYLLSSFIFAIGMFFLITLVLSTAEGLTRKAFGNKIQFWKLWSQETASSLSVFGQTVGGYLLASLQLGFVVATYFFATRFLGWWGPSDILVNPNILATYFPWLSSVSTALSAGLIEECLFRAIPLAGAALLGKKYGHKTWWIVGALILQAVIFGGAHANYPAQPAYARLVELIIPSLTFGIVYLIYGLLPAIISHFVYDLVLMSLPLFVSSGTGQIINQVIVILAGLLPLAIVLFARFRKKRFVELQEKDYNSDWKPPKLKIEQKNIPPILSKKTEMGSNTKKGLLIAGTVSIVAWIGLTKFKQESLSLNISRTQAINLAKKELDRHNISLNKTWQALPVLAGNYAANPNNELQHHFVWQLDKQLYRNLMGTYLKPAQWIVRFVTFDGDITKRSEEYQVVVAQNGTVTRFVHKLPSTTRGAQLNKIEARKKAYAQLKQQFDLKPETVQEVSAVAIKKPNRMDWLFSFSDLSIKLEKNEQESSKKTTVGAAGQALRPSSGQARVNVLVCGDSICDSFRSVHVPEDWQRKERRRKNTMSIVQIICMLFLLIIFITTLLKGTSSQFSLQTAVLSFVLLIIFHALNIANNWPAASAQLNTSEAYGHQTFVLLALLCLGNLIYSGLLALLFGLSFTREKIVAFWRNIKTFSAGIGLGTILLVLFSAWKFFVPATKPLWATFNHFGSYFPIVAIIGQNIVSYSMITALALLLLGTIDKIYARSQKNVLIIFLFFVLTGTAAIGIQSPATIMRWLTCGTLFGITLFVAYSFVLHNNRRIAIPALGIVFAGNLVQQAMFSAYSGSAAGYIIAAASILMTSAFLFTRTKN